MIGRITSGHTALLSLLTFVSAATSCFTGIESTPRIEAPKEETRTADAATDLLSDLTPEPPGSWKAGKEFAVTDNRFSMLLGATAPSYGLAGTTVRYAGARKASTVTGARVTDLVFVTGRGDTIRYRSASETPSDVPFLVDMNLVKASRERLAGRRLWLETAVWRDSADATVRGRKYIPVEVTRVDAGTTDCPVRVAFTALDGAEPASGYMFMMTGPDDGRPRRRFGSLFSLTDPRLRYPSVSDEMWSHIIRGEVAPGMTRDQVRLSAGSPRDIDRNNGNGSAGVYRERWFYANGLVVTFENGTVVR